MTMSPDNYTRDTRGVILSIHRQRLVREAVAALEYEDWDKVISLAAELKAVDAERQGLGWDAEPNPEVEHVCPDEGCGRRFVGPLRPPRRCTCGESMIFRVEARAWMWIDNTASPSAVEVPSGRCGCKWSRGDGEPILIPCSRHANG